MCIKEFLKHTFYNHDEIKVNPANQKMITNTLDLCLSLLNVQNKRKMNMQERISTDDEDDVVISSLLPGLGAVYHQLCVF